jgi:hypothetical protein
MTAATFDLSRFQAKLAAVRAALPQAVETYLPGAVTLALSNPDYLAPMADEEDHPLTADDVITDLEWDGTLAAVGVIQVYTWVIAPEHQHCQLCLDYAAGGPYRATDLSEQPGEGADLGLPLVSTHSAKNPCYCTLAPRDPTWQDSGPQALADAAAAIFSDLGATWTRS